MSKSGKWELKKFSVVTTFAVSLMLFATSAIVVGWFTFGIRVGVKTDPADSTIVIHGQEVGKTDAASADAEIRHLLDRWAQTSRNRDIDGQLRYYADVLDFYYNRNVVPSAKVREDRARAFARFNTNYNIELANIDIHLDSTGHRATVTLDKTFDFRGDNNSSFNGSVQAQLDVARRGGSWLITGEKELKVYYINR